MYDLLIKGATVIDGASGSSRVLDVAVSGGLIVALGPSINKSAKKLIKATDMILCPGFVDVQNHSDTSGKILIEPNLSELLKQGLTSISLGHCGSSLAPFNSQAAYNSIAHWHGGEPLNIGWQNTGEYLSRLNEMGLGLNVVTFVGLDNLIAGNQNQKLETVIKALEQELNNGACGLSARITEDFPQSGWDILESATTILAKKNSALSIHIDDSKKSLDQIEKLVSILQSTGLRAKISHINSLCTNSQFEQIVKVLENAWHQGVKIFFDVYPEVYSQHRLKDLVLPNAKLLQNITPEDKKRYAEKINNYQGSVGELKISRSRFSSSSVGKTIAEVASSMGLSSEEACLSLLCQGGEDLFVFKKSTTDEQLFSLMKHPQAMLASNTSQPSAPSLIKRFIDHPRNTLSFPKFLAIAQEKNIDLVSLIGKMSTRPANFLGIKNRGVLESGKIADLVLIDLHRPYGDSGNEKQFLEKIRYVFLRGEAVVDNGNLSNEHQGVAIAL